MTEFIKKFVVAGKNEENPKEKSQSSLLIRDRGNKAYSKKDFNAALLHFSQSALMGPIDDLGKGQSYQMWLFYSQFLAIFGILNGLLLIF